MTREELSEKIKDHLKKWIEGEKEFTLESEGENRINISFKLKDGTNGTIDLTTTYHWLNFEFFMDDTTNPVNTLEWIMEPVDYEEFRVFGELLPYVEFTAWGEGKELGKMETIDDKPLMQDEMFKEYLKAFEYVDSMF
jgi:hypothetical protein